MHTEEKNHTNTHQPKVQQAPSFQYSYTNLSCEFCLHYKKCPHELCPHIMGNLDELMCDTAFVSAVENAASYKDEYGHKQTLLRLNAMAT